MEVVIKAVLDHGADRDLRAGESSCTASASTWAASCRISSSAARVLTRDEFDLRVAIEPAGEIAQAPSMVMATLRFASDGEMFLAMSRPVTPGSN